MVLPHSTWVDTGDDDDDDDDDDCKCGATSGLDWTCVIYVVGPYDLICWCWTEMINSIYGCVWTLGIPPDVDFVSFPLTFSGSNPDWAVFQTLIGWWLKVTLLPFTGWHKVDICICIIYVYIYVYVFVYKYRNIYIYRYHIQYIFI